MNAESKSDTQRNRRRARHSYPFGEVFDCQPASRPRSHSSSPIRPGFLSRRDSVKIARRFNAGTRSKDQQSPEGTADFSFSSPCVCSRPFGTQVVCAAVPAVNCRAIVECPSGTFWKNVQTPGPAGNGAPVGATLTVRISRICSKWAEFRPRPSFSPSSSKTRQIRERGRERERG
jgi:hypothetical protein